MPREYDPKTVEKSVQHHPDAVGRRRRKGEVRSSRHADGARRDRLRDLDAASPLRSERRRAGPTATASCSRAGTRRCCSTRCSTSSGYDLPLDELKRFRQWGSKTPGHPESFTDAGRRDARPGRSGRGSPTRSAWRRASRCWARASTSRAHLHRARVFGICSDGDIMEGISRRGRRASPGTSGSTTSSSSTTTTTSPSTARPSSRSREDVGKRYEAYGWFVQHIDGHDHGADPRGARQARSPSRRALR